MSTGNEQQVRRGDHLRNRCLSLDWNEPPDPRSSR
jgi:hypothetical protein